MKRGEGDREVAMWHQQAETWGGREEEYHGHDGGTPAAAAAAAAHHNPGTELADSFLHLEAFDLNNK